MMSTLQEVTDYAALVFMGLMVLGLISLIITTITIKHKISEAKQKVEDAFNLVSGLPYIGKQIFKAVKENIK